MKLLMLLLAMLMAFPACATAEDYANPMNLPEQYPPFTATADDYGIGDPFVMRYNGLYYLYASSSEARVRVWTSRDLVNWQFEGWCTQGRDVDFAYAPEVVYWRGSFYMITSPGGGGHYILKSDDPLGVFLPVTKNFGHSIDGSFFKLDDGQLMMLFPDNWLIKSAMLDEETMLPSNIKSDTGATLRHWTEGPGLFRRGDWYYLTFTGNHVCSTGYKVAWASREGGPRGQFMQREESTLLVNSVHGDDFTGLGHSANVLGPDLDSMYTTYHSLVSLTGPARQYNLDRLFTNNGLLYTSGPSNSAMPVPQMPDVWGDAAAELGDFTESADGYFAQLNETGVFTQEWNFRLNGGTARALIGQRDGADVTVTVDQSHITLYAGDAQIETAKLPEIGPEGCLHTLRVEHNADVLHLYVDDMRVITRENPGFTASHVGVYKQENVIYSFLGCTAQALGSSDNTALKLLPGGFSAVHALNREALSLEDFGTQKELAPRLGSADYNVRIAAAGEYAFDLLVQKADAGKQMTVALDGNVLWTGTAPTFKGRGKTFTFTTGAVTLPAGDHTLTITGEDVLLNRVTAFACTKAETLHFDFSTKEQREHFITLGAFTMKPAEKQLGVRSKRNGYALFGDEGMTDYALDVRFDIPSKGDGGSGILLRATDVSVYDAQVKQSYYGYAVVVSKRGVTLSRSRYGQVGTSNFAAVPGWDTAGEGQLHIEVRGNAVDIYLPGEEKPLLHLEDAKPFTHGMYGFFSNGTELYVNELAVTPLD